MAKTVYVRSGTAVCHLHKVGHHGVAVGSRRLLHPTNINRRNDWAHEIERSLAFWIIVIFSDESRFLWSVVECGFGDSII